MQITVARVRSKIGWWFFSRWPFLPVWFINWREDLLDKLMYKRLDDYKACEYLVEQAIGEGELAGQGHRVWSQHGFWDIIVRPSKPEDVYDGSSLSSFTSWKLRAD